MADADKQTEAEEYESIGKVKELSYYGHNTEVRIPDCESSRNMNYQEYFRICHRSAWTCVVISV